MKNKTSKRTPEELEALREEYNKKFDNTPINIETNLAHVLAQAACLLIRDADRRFRASGVTFIHEKKQKFRELQDCAKRIYDIEERYLSGEVWQGSKGNADRFDSFYRDANEYARLCLLYTERTDNSVANKNAVFAFIEALSGGLGIMKPEEIDRFSMGDDDQSA